MKRMKVFVLWLYVLLPVVMHAQTYNYNKLRYGSTYDIGMLCGKAYNTVNPQMIQGIKFNHFFTGVGASLDPYGFRTVPVFAHLRYSLWNDKNTPFAFASGGVSIPWNNGALPEKYPYNNDDEKWHKLKTGPYVEAGIGYSLKLNKRNAINISMAYSYKRFNYDEYRIVYYTEYDKVTDHYTYDYRRLALRIGFQL